MPYNLFAISVRGAKNQTQLCQDAADKDETSDWQMIAVADGHGDKACFRSQIGSKLAVQAAFETMKDKLCKSAYLTDSDAIHVKILVEQRWRTLVMEDLVKNPLSRETLSDFNLCGKTYEEFYHIYGTTLLYALATEQQIFLLQIGDGTCVLCKNNGIWGLPIDSDNDNRLNITSSLSSPKAYLKMRHVLLNYSASDTDNRPIAIFLNTDGLDNCFTLAQREKQLCDFYRIILEDIIERGLEKTNIDIEPLLYKMTQNGSMDDISIAYMLADRGSIKASYDKLKSLVLKEGCPMLWNNNSKNNDLTGGRKKMNSVNDTESIKGLSQTKEMSSEEVSANGITSRGYNSSNAAIAKTSMNPGNHVYNGRSVADVGTVNTNNNSTPRTSQQVSFLDSCRNKNDFVTEQPDTSKIDLMYPVGSTLTKTQKYTHTSSVTTDSGKSNQLINNLNKIGIERDKADKEMSQKIIELQTNLQQPLSTLKETQTIIQNALQEIGKLRESLDYNVTNQAIHQFIESYNFMEEILEYHQNNIRKDDVPDDYKNLIYSCNEMLDSIVQSLAMLGADIIEGNEVPFDPAKHKAARGSVPNRQSLVDVKKRGFIYKGKTLKKAEVVISALVAPLKSPNSHWSL